MKHCAIFFSFAFLTSWTTLGQDLCDTCTYQYTKGEIKEIKYHPHYVRPVPVTIASKQFLNYYTNLFIIGKVGSPESPIYYSPPTGMNIGADAAFKSFAFNYQRSIPVGRPDLPDGFRSYVDQVNLGLGGKSFGLGNNWKRYHGVYIMNGSKIPGGYYTNPDDVRFRNITTTLNESETRVKFSKKFAMNAFIDQREVQLESRGTYTMLYGNKFVGFAGDSAFIPPHLRALYGGGGAIDEIWTNTVYTMPGFGYIHVLGLWNFGLLTYQGAGVQFGNSFIGNQKTTVIGYPLLGDFRTVVSYNHKYLYGNAALGMNYMSYTHVGIRYTWMQTFASFTIGARLLKRTDEEKAAKKEAKMSEPAN